MTSTRQNHRRTAPWVVLVVLVLVNHLALPLHLALEHHCLGHIETAGDIAHSCDDDGHPPHPIEDHADDRPDPATRSDLDLGSGDLDLATGPVEAVTVPPLRFAGALRSSAPDLARGPPIAAGYTSRAPPLCAA